MLECYAAAVPPTAPYALVRATSSRPRCATSPCALACCVRPPPPPSATVRQTIVSHPPWPGATPADDPPPLFPTLPRCRYYHARWPSVATPPPVWLCAPPCAAPEPNLSKSCRAASPVPAGRSIPFAGGVLPWRSVGGGGDVVLSIVKALAAGRRCAGLPLLPCCVLGFGPFRRALRRPCPCPSCMRPHLPLFPPTPFCPAPAHQWLLLAQAVALAPLPPYYYWRPPQSFCRSGARPFRARRAPCVAPLRGPPFAISPFPSPPLPPSSHDCASLPCGLSPRACPVPYHRDVPCPWCCSVSCRGVWPVILPDVERHFFGARSMSELDAAFPPSFHRPIRSEPVTRRPPRAAPWACHVSRVAAMPVSFMVAACCCCG